MKDLLKRAKENDFDAKEEIIKMYYPLIVKEAKNVFLKNRTFEDIIQTGIVNLLHSIEKFDLSIGAEKFPSYALWSIKNGFRYLCRSEIRYNDELSLNKTNDQGFEVGESIIDDNINVEGSVLGDILNKELYLAIKTLDKEERELIKFLFIKNERPNLSKYCAIYQKDYYYANSLKKRALKKLNKFFSQQFL